MYHDHASTPVYLDYEFMLEHHFCNRQEDPLSDFAKGDRAGSCFFLGECDAHLGVDPVVMFTMRCTQDFPKNCFGVGNIHEGEIYTFRQYRCPGCGRYSVTISAEGNSFVECRLKMDRERGQATVL